MNGAVGPGLCSCLSAQLGSLARWLPTWGAGAVCGPRDPNPDSDV